MKKNFEAIIVLFLSGIIFFLFFFAVIPNGLTNLNSYFFSTNHDGIKNYYTYLYYLKFDSGFHFSGMAYPFGDLITFTDNQPLLVLTIKSLQYLGLNLNTYSVAIFNILLLLAFPITVLVLYKILKNYQVSNYYSFFIALAITFLNPQIERLAGHYALAYSFVIPLFWLLDIKISSSKNKWLLVSLTIIIILLLTFLHVYYLALALIFFMFSAIAKVLLSNYAKPNLLQIAKTYIPLSFLPMIIFKLFMGVMDNVNDRVAFPYGFLSYRASYCSIFFNQNSPFDSYIPNFLKVGKNDFEGHAYLGFYGLIFTAFVLYCFFKETYKNKKWNFETLNFTYQVEFKPYIVLALLALCIGAAFPLYMPPFDIIIEYITPLAQFRSPGRFAWIYFFIFSVFFYLYLYKLSQEEYNNWKKYLLPIILVISLFEGIKITHKTLSHLNETTLADSFFEQNLSPVISKHNFNSSNYQAIIAFPFFTIGNEKAGFAGSNQSIFNAMKTSYQSGLPLVNYMMSRTGINQGLQIAQFTSNSFLPKAYLNYIDSIKPLLLIVGNDELSETEKEIVSIAQHISTINDIHFYSLNPSEIKNIYQNKMNEVMNKKWHLIKNQSNVFCLDSIAPFFYLKSNVNSNELYKNNDAILNKSGDQIVYEGKFPISDSLAISYWGRAKNSIYGFPNLKYTEYNSNGDQVFHYDSHVSNDLELFECTRRVRYTFKPQSAENSVKIRISGKKFNYSNLVIQKTNSQVVFKDQYGNWFWNNYPSKIPLVK
jgi:hypothetical protein